MTITLKNNNEDYYHWLPTVDNFPGGVINFRKTLALPESVFKKDFSPPIIQISSQFIKDIISRFSTYYARQGQPEFEFDLILDNILGVNE